MPRTDGASLSVEQDTGRPPGRMNLTCDPSELHAQPGNNLALQGFWIGAERD